MKVEMKGLGMTNAVKDTLTATATAPAAATPAAPKAKEEVAPAQDKR
jgi:hypothetical protein